MRIAATKPIPSNTELIAVLKKEFSSQYQYQIFGIGSNKTIIVGQTPFVGVQITRFEKEFSTNWTTPTLSATLLSVVIPLVLETFASLFMMFNTRPYAKLEKEVASFLNSKYNI